MPVADYIRIKFLLCIFGAALLMGCEYEVETRKTVELNWQSPSTRVNDVYMEADEIGGYEIRYKNVEDTEYSRIVIQASDLETWEIPSLLPGTYEVSVAVFDESGFFSDYSDSVEIIVDGSL